MNLDKILIKDLLAHGIIGITDEERAAPQDILINIVLYADISAAAQYDTIDDCVNYATLAKLIRSYAEKAARHTVEALATDIAQICLKDQRVLKVSVRVEKPGAVKYTGSVGVEIERDASSISF